MAKTDKIKYWLKSANHDWEVAMHLFEKGDYAYALFFGHLTVEKILKAVFTDRYDNTPPFSHNLVYLAEKANLNLSEECLDLLEEVSDFNLEARYPDHKFSFYKKCTMKFAEKKLQEIDRMKRWLLQKLRLSI